MSEYDPRSLSEMEKAINILNSADSYDENSPINDHNYHDDNSVSKKQPTTENSGDVYKDMSNIMDRFNKAAEEAAKAAGEENNPDIKQIKETTYDDDTNTLSIGDFKVSKNSKELYDVYDNENKVLISDCFLYETAFTVATLLYQGCSFNSSKVLNVLNLNEKYEKHLTDAKIHKTNYNKYSKMNNIDKKELEEMKFEDNKSKAIKYKRSIMERYKHTK